ncbi:hypothetical protein HK096_001446 [Nowakowskiella sp. JEL0078]|nr:hypothetical protein HK096_001446 [Nowakowskiella sp. JEL0078]
MQKTRDMQRGRGRGRGGRPNRAGGNQRIERTGTGAEFDALFGEFSAVLDEFYDRRERIIKISRDITIASKRVIFLLHRAFGEERDNILEEAQEKQSEIIELFKIVSVELQNHNYYRHLRSISPGIEEFIESATFFYYVKVGKMCDLEYIQSLLSADDGSIILLITPQDFVLGTADLTGEMMRYCINSVGRGDHELAGVIADDLRRLRNDYELLNFPPSFKKMSAMRSSCQKAENALYSIQVRGSEFPDASIEYLLQKSQPDPYSNANYESNDVLRQDEDDY